MNRAAHQRLKQKRSPSSGSKLRFSRNELNGWRSVWTRIPAKDRSVDWHRRCPENFHEELRNQDQSGDVKALLHRLQGPLIRYALQITGDLERARDVVQDTFLQLCSENRASLNGHLEPWLFTVCRNRALDVRRKEGRMNPHH